MAEELQGLLDRIRTEGLDKAEAEAKTIIEDARRKAAEITKAAEQDATRKIAEAETEAAKFEQRSVSAVEQAARDVVLSVGDAIQQAFSALAQKEISEALDGELFAKTVADVIQTYSKQDDNTNLEVLLSPKQHDFITNYLNKALSDEMRKSISIKSNRGIISGFSVVLREQGVEHDFRGETLTAAFLELLRPQLGEIIKSAMAKIKKPS